MPQTTRYFILFWTIALGVCADSGAAQYNAVVTEAVSGDALLVRDAQERIHPVRLLAVSAPVEGQPYHAQAVKALRRLVVHQKVWVDWFGKTGNCARGHLPGECRELAKVFLDGEDIALKLLQRGWVWHDERQVEEQSVADRGLYTDAEDMARRKHLGLWRDRHAVEPWRWEQGARRPREPAHLRGKRKGKMGKKKT